MLDRSLEQKLQAALRAEGDDLAFTITADELERRLALRRRSGPIPMASLGLAAAVGIGLLGLAALAGGWFEKGPVVSPAPSQAAVVSAGPDGSQQTPDGSAGVQPVLLPSLDELLAPIDEATVVRAQAYGPADGPMADVTPVGPRFVTFDPFVVAGSYRVWTACVASDQLSIVVTPAGGLEPRENIPITCDASITARQVGIEAGDTIGVRASGPVSWRVAVGAPGRAALHATAIAAILPSDADQSLLDIASGATAPSYAEPSAAAGNPVPEFAGGVPAREGYRVSFSCAGPRPIRYAFRTEPAGSTGAGDLVDELATEVECDGATHTDELRLPLPKGADLYVTADPRTAWRIIVSSATPPIALAPDGKGWMLSTGFGPNYEPSGGEAGVSLVGAEHGGRTRVVISCFGDGSISGSIGVGRLESDPVDPFMLDCNVEHNDSVTLARTYPDAAGQIHVVFDPHGATIWLAVSIQVPAPASPAP